MIKKNKPNRAKALFTSEQRYRTLVETMGDGLSEIDENQVTTYANEMLCQMWGRSKDDMVSPFLHKLSLEFLNLTPSEIQVANLVKFGKSTKEIAQILHLSGKTIEFYRKSIRKKVGITNKNINLRTFLSST